MKKKKTYLVFKSVRSVSIQVSNTFTNPQLNLNGRTVIGVKNVSRNCMFGGDFMGLNPFDVTFKKTSLFLQFLALFTLLT